MLTCDNCGAKRRTDEYTAIGGKHTYLRGRGGFTRECGTWYADPADAATPAPPTRPPADTPETVAAKCDRARDVGDLFAKFFGGRS